MTSQKNALFVKGISSNLSDSDILDLMCATFSHAALFDRAYSQTALSDDTNKRRAINNYLYGTVDNVIVKRPKFSPAQAESGFINAIVYFEQISFDRIGKHNFDSLNNGGFIKIVFCPSTATSPVKYWKVFKYDGDRTRMLQNHPNVSGNRQNNNNNNNVICHESNRNSFDNATPRCSVYGVPSISYDCRLRKSPNRISAPEPKRKDFVDIRRDSAPTVSGNFHVNLANTVVLRKHPAPKPNVKSKYYQDDGEDESGMIM